MPKIEIFLSEEEVERIVLGGSVTIVGRKEPIVIQREPKPDSEYVILVGTRVGEVGLHYEIIYYDETSDDCFSSQLSHEFFEQQENCELKSRFLFDEAQGIITRKRLQEHYDVVEINETVR